MTPTLSACSCVMTVSPAPSAGRCDVVISHRAVSARGTHRSLVLPTFMPSKPSEPENSILLSKCLVFPTNALSSNFLKWSKMLMLKLPVEEIKMSISDMTPRRLQGVERVTFCKKTCECQNHGERKRNLRRIRTLTHASHNHHINCARDAVLERVTATVQ